MTMILNDYSHLWDQMAKYWDSRDDWGYNNLLLPTLIELLGSIRDKKVIDLGCGTGDFSRHISMMGANVLGVDFSPEMVRIANDNEKNKPSGAKFIVADALTLNEVGDDCYDIAVCNMSMQSFSDYEAAIKTVARILKPFGTFIFSFEHPFFALGRKAHTISKRKWVSESGENENPENLSYFREHKQEIQWPNEQATFHFFRPLGIYSNCLSKYGFNILEINEPEPLDIDKENLEKYGVYKTLPRFMIIKAQLLSGMNERPIILEPQNNSLNEFQLNVHNWMLDVGTYNWGFLSVLAQMTEELGEVARIINGRFGDKVPKSTDHISDDELALELGDLLFALLCLSDKLNMDLSNCLLKTIKKNEARDINRFKNKEGKVVDSS